jgi:hypothetical protein
MVIKLEYNDMQMSVACYVERKKRADSLLLAVLFQG